MFSLGILDPFQSFLYGLVIVALWQKFLLYSVSFSFSFIDKNEIKTYLSKEEEENVRKILTAGISQSYNL